MSDANIAYAALGVVLLVFLLGAAAIMRMEFWEDEDADPHG